MQVAVVLLKERPEGNEVLVELHLCERCSELAEDALSVETTVIAVQ